MPAYRANAPAWLRIVRVILSLFVIVMNSFVQTGSEYLFELQVVGTSIPGKFSGLAEDCAGHLVTLCNSHELILFKLDLNICLNYRW
jgi:hypothetical protein